MMHGPINIRFFTFLFFVFCFFLHGLFCGAGVYVSIGCEWSHFTFALTAHLQVLRARSSIPVVGACGGAVAWGTALRAGRSRVEFPMVSLEFFIDIILPATLWPWSFSVSNRNEYQEYILGFKGGRFVRMTTLPLSCAECLEIWEPQPLGTLRACPGL